MLGIGAELSIFLEAVLTGIVLLAVYQILRVIRRLIRHNLIVIGVEDFFFWIGSALYLFWKMYETSDGNIRWFFVIGVVTGISLLWGGCRGIKRLATTLFQ